MRRFLLVSLAALIVLAAAAGAAGVAGYFIHREVISPFHGLAERAITKGRRVLGMPTETVNRVARIRTTYVTLRGTVTLMPDNDFLTGGALTLWGEDILAMHQRGRIFRFDEAAGALVPVDIAVPDNGMAGYLALAAEKYPEGFTREGTIRYNDIEFVDSPAFRGFILSYTFIDADRECYLSRLAKLAVPREVASVAALSATAEDWEVLYDTQPCLPFNPERELIVGYMAGGRIAFKAPDLVYLGSGEYHREGFYRPDAGIQDPDSDYGKTLEINVTTGQGRVYSIGHRNLQGVALDAQGRLWTTEHGMRGGDELNLILDGENYGWPLENLGTLYSGIPAPTEGRVGRHEIYRAPVYAWLPSAAVSSMTLVEDFDETWDGDLLIGSLKGETLFRARIQDDRLVFLEPIPIGERIRDVMQAGPGRIALWMDTNELVVLTKEEQVDPLAGLEDGLVAEGMAPARAEEVRAVLMACNECHSYEENVHGAGPSLYKLVGRRVAGTAFAGYSDALKARGGSWDEAALAAYLADPGAAVPGTTMTGQGVGNAETAAAVARGFAWLSARSKDLPEL